MDTLTTLLVIAGLVIVTMLIVAALLIQFGCYISGAEVPSFGRAFGVNILFIIVATMVHFALLFAIGLTLERWGYEDANNTSLAWGLRGAMYVGDIFVIGLLAMMCLNKVNFWRGIVVGLTLSLGLTGLGIVGFITLGSMIVLQQ